MPKRSQWSIQVTAVMTELGKTSNASAEALGFSSRDEQR